MYINDTMSVATSGNDDLLLPWRTKMGITANLPDMTVVRIRGVVNVEQSSASLLDVTSGVQCGILVLPSTIPAAQIPKPLTDPWNDWLYWKLHSPFLQTATGKSASLAAAWDWAIELDTKAMRKLQNIDDTIFFCYEGQGAQTYTVRVNLAVGVKIG
jgi:hypothetical protein